jgi:hypothetical protein
MRATSVATPPGTNGLIAWQQETANAPPHLWVANPDRSQAREVFAEDGAATLEAAFSPVNAAALPFTHATQKPFSEEIFLGDSSPARCARWRTQRERRSRRPSPRRQAIAFFSVRPAGRNRPPAPERIGVMNIDGTGRPAHAQEPAKRRPGLLSGRNADRLQRESAPRPIGCRQPLDGHNADGTHRRAVTRYGGRREINPKWLADGSGLVFESLNRRSLKSDIERIGIDGRGRRAVLATSAFETNPVPSPDGMRTVFTSDRDRRGPTRLGPGFEVYTMSVDGTDIVRLTANKERDLFPDWQRLP